MIKVINIDTEKFKNTNVGKRMLNDPLGFFDVGSLGGIHPIADDMSKFLNVACFEPNKIEIEKIKKDPKNTKYNKVLFCKNALSNKKGIEELYITKLPTNASLLKPSKKFIKRYNAINFEILKKLKIETTTIDLICKTEEFKNQYKPEFIKLDTQGTEYEILEGAKINLNKTTTAILCEVSFFKLYEKQKFLHDICSLLYKYGFKLYGLYPNYRSTQMMSKNDFEYEERLIWGDAVFFWDPFDEHVKNITPRRIDSLLISTIILGYYDFSLEINEKYNKNHKDKKIVKKLIEKFAKERKKYVDQKIKKITSGNIDINSIYHILDEISFNSSHEKPLKINV